MKDFSTQILRERFVFAPLPDDGTEPIIALSNRAPLSLIDSDGNVVERFVVRGHMLHSVVRMVGSMMNTFSRTGPLLHRQVPLDWDHIWDLAAGPHERAHNPQLWVAVYHQGKVIFENGARHNFLDIIEQCDTRGDGDYGASLKTAEELFIRAGKPVKITPESSIAATFQIGAAKGRASLILRGAQKRTTFTFTGEARDMPPDRHLNPVHFINAAAAFLEGIQLAFTLGSGNEKLRRNVFTAHSEEGRMVSSARTRLAETNAAIRTFENLHVVHYRPERPDFPALITNAEQMTRRRLDDEEMEESISPDDPSVKES